MVLHGENDTTYESEDGQSTRHHTKHIAQQSYMYVHTYVHMLLDILCMY